LVVLGVLVAAHAWRLARAEALLAGSGVPAAGTAMPMATARALPRPVLERMRAALEAALGERPDWAEGHLRLGMTLVGLYELTAAEWIGDEVADPARRSALADSLWLHAAVHAAEPEDRAAVIDHIPVRTYLVPAAKSFLEARRICPWLAPSHARLAGLDYLLVGVDGPGVHAARALRCAGADSPLLLLAARAAAQAGEHAVAARAWRRALEVREQDREAIVDAAAGWLSPDQVVDLVLPQGAEWAVWFADRSLAGPGDAASRDRCFRSALRQLPGDARLPAADRLRLEARARAGLGEVAGVGALWEAALAAEPQRAEWREEYVHWLAGRGEDEAAYRQAVLGVRFSPAHDGLRRALEVTADALARQGH
jgi:tetratricopeptide (TPR) repeat protein